MGALWLGSASLYIHCGQVFSWHQYQRRWCQAMFGAAYFFGLCFRRSSIPSMWAKSFAHPFNFHPALLRFDFFERLASRCTCMDIYDCIQTSRAVFVCLCINTKRYTGHHGFISVSGKYSNSSSSFPSSCVRLRRTEEPQGVWPYAGEESWCRDMDSVCFAHPWNPGVVGMTVESLL